jgi:hypothetical protein
MQNHYYYAPAKSTLRSRSFAQDRIDHPGDRIEHSGVRFLANSYSFIKIREYIWPSAHLTQQMALYVYVYIADRV